MCWLCGPVRPYDGPEELKIHNDGLIPSYKKDGAVYTPIESGAWESLSKFPAFNNSEYFSVRKSTKADRAVGEMKSLFLWKCWECGAKAESSSDSLPAPCYCGAVERLEVDTSWYLLEEKLM